MSGLPFGYRFSRRHQRLLGSSVLAVLALAAFLHLSSSESPVEASPEPTGILIHDADDLRYTYHVLTDTECLFDLRADPRCLNNLAPIWPELTIRIRLHFQAELGVNSFDQYRDRFNPTIHRLRGLGYL